MVFYCRKVFEKAVFCKVLTNSMQLAHTVINIDDHLGMNFKCILSGRLVSF